MSSSTMSSEATTSAPWFSVLRSVCDELKIAAFGSTSEIHDLTRQQGGLDFIFEALEGDIKAYITGQLDGVKTGDRLVLEVNGQPKHYLIEALEYYSSLPDMWTASLTCIG